ncbi:MAG TPA: EthD family reductase [Nocardioides sp.]|nr:EthD family reductase [Nocardioides sp.]
MIKLTALFGHPDSVDDFETHYLEKHVPIARSIPNLVRLETARTMPSPSGEAPPYHRIAELWFDDLTSLGAALASEQGQAASADIGYFATGGATLFLSDIDD